MLTQLPQRRLLQALCEFANGRALRETFSPGLRFDMNEASVLSIRSLSGTVWELRTTTRQLLTVLAHGDPDAIEAAINTRTVPAALISGPRVASTAYRRPTAGPALLTPVVNGLDDLPWAVLALARCTATGTGDTLADRVARCAECQQFFLLPTRRSARFCSKRCRNRADHRRTNRRSVRLSA